jgi:hypothetical protein
MRPRLVHAALFGILAFAIVGCGGGDGGVGETAPSGESGDRNNAISEVVELWANAYAKQDTAYCEYEAKKYERLCRGYLAGGKPTVYQTGYLNAKVDGIELDGSKRGTAALTNGCEVEVSDEGGGDWRVTNSGGSLARGCEQGTGR